MRQCSSQIDRHPHWSIVGKARSLPLRLEQVTLWDLALLELSVREKRPSLEQNGALKSVKLNQVSWGTMFLTLCPRKSNLICPYMKVLTQIGDIFLFMKQLKTCSLGLFNDLTRDDVLTFWRCSHSKNISHGFYSNSFQFYSWQSWELLGVWNSNLAPNLDKYCSCCVYIIFYR